MIGRRFAMGAAAVLLVAASVRAQDEVTDISYLEGASTFYASYAVEEPAPPAPDAPVADSAAGVGEACNACGTGCDTCGGCCDTCGDGCDSCGDCCDFGCPPLWTVRAGAVILGRYRPRSALLLEDTLTGTELLNANNFDTAWSGGPDITVRRRIGTQSEIDVRYFSVDSWSSDVSLVTSPIFNLPTNPPLFGGATADLLAKNRARLFNTEINLRRRTSDWLTLLVGFRWIELHENLNMAFDFGPEQSNVQFDTDNHLYGGQVGGDFTLWNTGGPFQVQSILKAGIFGNAADAGYSVVQTADADFGSGDRRGQVAFVGEIGVTGVYQLTRHVALRGGYQLLWIEGVAVATDQPAATNVLQANGINSRGGEFFHGALTSLDFTW